MISIEHIKALGDGDRKMQKWLYDHYAPLFFAICRRYVRNYEDAEDILVEGMFKIFMNVNQYKFKGSFEGWMRRIIVNECLMHLRKNTNFNFVFDLSKIDLASQMNIESELYYKDLLIALDHLPPGYRTVFNLYVIEGYKHREIAELLGISINTSKSQLIQAKKRMKQILKKKQIEKWA